MDISEQRLQRVIENSERLGLAMTTVTADASKLQESIRVKHLMRSWRCALLGNGGHSSQPRCENSPTTRRYRLIWRAQLAILKGLWPALKPGGRLLYVTCSLLEAENDGIIAAFTDHTESIIRSLSLSQGLPTQCGWQTLPLPSGGNGLFFSMLEKPG